ncbi:MAG: NHL repeat-containing protein [Chloroflexota bacterium]
MLRNFFAITMLCVSLLAGVTWITASSHPGAIRASYAFQYSNRHCHLVNKRVRGHRKKVRVCRHKRRHPTPVPPLFDGPSDLVVDAHGNVLVADQLTRSIMTLSPDGKLLSRWTDAGSKPSSFDQLYGIALDRYGNVYVSDAAAHLIDKLDPSGRPLAQWNVNPAEQNSFPTLLAIGNHGDIYVADHAAEAVLHLSSSGALLGSIGKGDFVDPYGVAAGPGGNLYVTDFGAGNVREYTPDGSPVAVLGDGADGTPQLAKPEAIAVDAQGNIYVSEQAGRLLKLDSTGKILATWGGTASLTLSDPSGIALDPQGDIYVSEYGGNRVDKLSPSGDLLTAWQ